MMFYHSGRGRYAARFSGGGGIGCLIFGILGLVAAYYILKGFFIVLYWAAPALFVLALIINWRAVVDTFKSWLKSMETNPVGGLLTAALAVLVFPVFALYLFVKSLGYNRIEKIRREAGAQEGREEGEFVEFEEIESFRKGEEDAPEPMEPPDLPEPQTDQPKKAAPKKPDNPYDQFFGD
ncbi:MAG: hypothetical protein H6565_09940 [Lewinellaceae bacterium]|nr:hypothetical protein [Lewinellaceae bacterium]